MEFAAVSPSRSLATLRAALSIAPLLLAGVPAAADGRQGPSYDCAKAATAVEKQICDDWTLSAYDLWVAEIYTGLRERLDAAGKERLKAEQIAWLKEARNPCGQAKALDASTPDSAAVWSCLRGAYETRAIELAQTLEASLFGEDSEGPWSGSYAADDGYSAGSIVLLQMPEGPLTLQLSSVSGPSYHICELTAGGVRRGPDLLQYRDSEETSCLITFARVGDGRGTVEVSSAGCALYCGANGYFDGTYTPVRPLD